MRLSRWTFPFLTLLSTAPQPSLAKNGIIYTDAVSYCTEARAVLVDTFDIAYHQSNQSITFSFSLAAVESNLNVSANLYLNAYGMNLINVTLDLCTYFEGVICPLPQANFTGYGTYPVPTQYITDIPGIAYTVPNLEAYARVELLRETTGEIAACLQATLANGKTTRHTAVAYATGFFTLVALLIAVFHNMATNSPSPAQYRWFDILYLFQTAAATGLLHLNYPLVYSQFTENFSWALGLFHSSAVQSTINKMRAKTGGSLDGESYNSVQYIDRKLSPYNEGFINLNAVTESTATFKAFLAESVPNQSTGLVSRASIASTVDQNSTTSLDTGIPVYTNSLEIAEANALSTAFFFFLAFIAAAVVFHILLYLVVFILDRTGKGRRFIWATRLRQMWWGFCAGNALRLCLIGFLPMWIFGFWQFYIGDSRLAIFFAVFGVLITLVPLAVLFVLSIIKNRRLSSTAPSISPLYTSYRWFHSVGVLYRPYRQRYHFFWFAPLVIAIIVRAAFIAFGPASAWVQVIGNIVVEFVVFIALLAFRPHKDRKGDWLVSFLAFCRLAAWGLLVAFIPSVAVKPIPRVIIGLVIVVLFGVPTILLFFGLIWNAGYGYLWRRHTHRIEDGLEVERFVAADDDSQEQGMQHVDAHNFVSARNGNGAEDSRGSLNRRTSVIEPVGNVYEPSLRSHHYPSSSSNEHHRLSRGGGGGMRENYDSPTSPTLATPTDHHRYSAAAYADAASGRGGYDGSETLSPGSGSGNGHSDERGWSRDQYYTGSGTGAKYR